METNDRKFRTVIDKNTFYFHNPVFQEKYESYINLLTETLLVLKIKVETQGLSKQLFEDLLADKENGLRALLALTGFANESLKRLITVVRVSEDIELSRLLFKEHWSLSENKMEVKEWGDSKIIKLLKNNAYFRKGIVNLFFEGSTTPYLTQTLPLFELKKLSISKLNFEMPAMIDTLVRYKEKGSQSGKAENNLEKFITKIFKEAGIPFEKGDLTELFNNESVAKRSMDFILPNKKEPQIIIECSFVVTTSSAQGDKAKTEVSNKNLISKYYPNAKFIGFVDGIGWYVRKGDLMRMVSAFDEVFTFHKDELERFIRYINKELKR